MADYHGRGRLVRLGRQGLGIAAAASVWLAGLFAPAAAAMRPAATTTASGWTITEVVRAGQLGFTDIVNARPGPDGAVVVYGYRGEERGIYRIENGAVTEVALVNDPFPVGGGYMNEVKETFLVLSNGDVIFEAMPGGSSLRSNWTYALRWRAGTITLAAPFEESDPNVTWDVVQAFDHDLRHGASDDRWMTTMTYHTNWGLASDVYYGLTDGSVYTTPLHTAGRVDGCAQTVVHRATVNAKELLLYYELTIDPANIGQCSDVNGSTHTWSLKLAGANTGLLASGSQVFGADHSRNGAELDVSRGLVFNDRSQVAVIRNQYTGTAQSLVKQLVLFEDGGGEEVIADTTDTLANLDLIDMDEDGVLLYQATDDSGANMVMVGNDQISDFVVRTGDTLFGKKLTTLAGVSPWAPSVNGDRAFSFVYMLADGSTGVALATHRVPRWKNANGGAWGAAANWDSGAVPGADANVEFDLDAAYGVDLGAHTASEAWVKRGDVEFRSGSLMLTGTTTSHLEVSGPLTDPAKLTISGVGTQVTATVFVGFNGSGELVIDDAIVWQNPGAAQGAEASLGFGGPATVTVSGAGAGWLWDELEMGVNEPSLLRVKEGALVGFGAQRAIIGGSELAFPVKNETARLVVDDAANTGMTMFGLVHDLTIGEGLIGEVSVLRGGSVSAITTTVGTRDHGAATDGWLTVDGLSTQGASRFESLGYDEGGLYASTEAGTSSALQVSGGGVMTVTQLTLAQAAGSSAYMSIDGTAAGRRSTVSATDIATETVKGGECVVAERGRATLQVTNGALLRCRRLAVGYLSGSRGVVEVDRFEGDYAEIAVADPDGDEVFGPVQGYGAICIGSAPLCDFSISVPRGNVQGDMLLGADGYVTARVMVVGAGGRLLGNGIVSTDEGVIVANGGRVAPGVIQLSNPRGMRTTTETVGTLTIEGGLTVSPGGVISLSVLGPTAGQQDLLVVSGTLDMRGQMALTFGNGYAPKAGDTLELMRAMTVTSAPPTVTISGLADGFAYEIDGVGGALTLTALTDGVPETTGGGAADSRVFVPLVRR